MQFRPSCRLTCACAPICLTFHPLARRRAISLAVLSALSPSAPPPHHRSRLRHLSAASTLPIIVVREQARRVYLGLGSRKKRPILTPTGHVAPAVPKNRSARAASRFVEQAKRSGLIRRTFDNES